MANITKKYSMNIKGILVIEDGAAGVENTETEEFLDFRDLLSDFADKDIKMTINYDEEYDSDN